MSALRLPKKQLPVGWVWVLEALVATAVALGAAAVITWPALPHTDSVIMGGGELGGWLWRYWWHFLELDALGESDLGWMERARIFFALGRYPETGNILDVLLISYPLQRLMELPGHYNAKIFLVLVGNGLCGYLLARSLVGSRSASLVAAVIAVVNPLAIQDIHGSGLRQVVLWWVLLLPVLLNRAATTGRWQWGAATGACFALSAGFFWIYGLFSAVFLGLWGLYFVWSRRGSMAWKRVARWAVPLVVTATVLSVLFFVPYLQAAGGAEAGGGTGTVLPELSFFLPFPEYDVIKDVPLRPSNYAENVLSSLNRNIMSSWSMDYLFNPAHFRALSLVVLLCGVIPALLHRGDSSGRGRFWLVVFFFFYLGTLGPYLKLGGNQDNAEVVRLFDVYVIRMPFTWMFRWIPGMSRMFAPYRMGAFMVVGAVALVALGLSRVGWGGQRRPWARRGLAVVAVAWTLGSTNYRWEIGPVPEDAIAPTMWRAPISVSGIHVPAFYSGLEKGAPQGIVELPLEQQQDLIYFYQVAHGWKVYAGWATPPAIPPVFRTEGGGAAGEQMRFLARIDRFGGEAGDLLLRLSRNPQEVDLDEVPDSALAHLFLGNQYRYLVVHERGYYLVDPMQGPLLYRDVVRRLEARLGVSAESQVEQEWFDYPGNRYQVPDGPVYIPWSSHEVNLPDRQMPNRYFMAVFDLAPFLDSYDGPPLPVVEEKPAEAPESDAAAQHEERVHENVPPPEDVPPPEEVEHKEMPAGAPKPAAAPEPAGG